MNKRVTVCASASEGERPTDLLSASSEGSELFTLCFLTAIAAPAPTATACLLPLNSLCSFLPPVSANDFVSDTSPSLAASSFRFVFLPPFSDAFVSSVIRCVFRFLFVLSPFLSRGVFVSV